MADDNRFRSNPPLGRGPAPSAPAHGGGRNDPLAELARLIGQTDPFGELNKTPGRPASAAPARSAPAPTPPQRRAPPSDPYGSPLQFDDHPFEARPRPDHRREDFQPAYDPAIYGSAAPQQPSEAYSDDPNLMHGEEVYEEEYEERPRRRWLKVAVFALIFFGGVGASCYVAYRSLFGASFSGPPPVIKANTAPNKMAPTPTAEASNKQIYDRVGDASPQGERVVPREEKPVDVKDNARPAPRLALPGSPGMAAIAEASPPMSADPVGPGSAEPKRVRTVTIRPDGGTGSAPAQRPNAAPARQGNAAPAQAGPGGGPLSLSPQVANAEASARQPFPPAQRPAAAQADPTRLAAMPPATDVAPGSYTVQISSQRSEAEAQSSFRSLQTKYPSVLGDRQPIIRRADLGDRGIFYRALVGPFASAEQASQFCGSLKSAGGQCVVQRN